ncbi:hypothetical protein [Ideonella sp. A 288]|uniref:hypothetical protein n=1 Tax=Ideonella sp. A 288 TaxID=1962181 RepID=UPI00118521D0|nr:hypothetical protein [Ideonella sp. A 288]
MTSPYVVTLSCPDRVGIVHAVTRLLVRHQANITEAARLNDASTGLLFMRVRFDASESASAALRDGFETMAVGFEMRWQLHKANARMPAVALVAKIGRCLNESIPRSR